ncbi:alkaline phosphatase family protein [Nocardioides acrostichi]|uniref:Alkaline phosphatase family protein n=1 Tax=Nocardioides acrostichi TaxID=2784339 RepID=A0A930Y6V6_9ACTN|nr:alkaline phosphatase family protein [Nocardioides acrostichi]MBF4161392.1 alkaline phosphatase family protein [Nocardioides acrostichi]
MSSPAEASSTTRPDRGRRLLRLVRRRIGAFRPSWTWTAEVVRSLITSFVALAVSLWVLPGTQVDAGATSVASLAITVVTLGAILRPLIVRLTVLTGAVGLLVSGFLAQAGILALALALLPTVEPFTLSEVVLAAWAAAATATAVNWLFDAGSDEAFLGQTLQRAVLRTPRAGVDGPGLLVVQLDGVSEPVLRQALTAGSLPTLSRWLRGGSHELRRWHTGIPATTPAGQAVLLHGDTTSVPGFRWWDRDQGRLVTASRPGDAAALERSLSTGRGLLADGGASVSNLLSGDAPERVLTVSDARAPGGDAGAASFATARSGFLRSVVLLVGQIVTELHQARRQRARGVLPRVRRGGRFALLRGVATVVLRDLTTSVVAEQLTRGTPVVFVDYVDYDEVAHHAGPTRPESLRTLEHLDQVLHLLEQVAEQVGRRYEIAVVSDHGQAQGTTFRQLTGRTLEQVVEELAAGSHPRLGGAGPDADDDELGIPAQLVLSAGAGASRAVARAATSAASTVTRRRRGSAGHDLEPAPEPAPEPARLLVAVSGSLAHVYRTDQPTRLSHARLERLHPGLVERLAAHPGVGAVMTRCDDGAVRVDGPGGHLVLGGDAEQPVVAEQHGRDPLAPYGETARADLLALDARNHVGDLVVLAAFDTRLHEVAAFEELVGSHGGLGGDQTEAFVVHPRGWRVPDGVLTGRQVHDVLVGRLVDLGLREEGRDE